MVETYDGNTPDEFYACYHPLFVFNQFGDVEYAMLDEVLAAGPENAGQAFFDRSIKQKESGGAGLGSLDMIWPYSWRLTPSTALPQN